MLFKLIIFQFLLVCLLAGLIKTTVAYDYDKPIDKKIRSNCEFVTLEQYQSYINSKNKPLYRPPLETLKSMHKSQMYPQTESIPVEDRQSAPFVTIRPPGLPQRPSPIPQQPLYRPPGVREQPLYRPPLALPIKPFLEAYEGKGNQVPQPQETRKMYETPLQYSDGPLKDQQPYVPSEAMRFGVPGSGPIIHNTQIPLRKEVITADRNVPQDYQAVPKTDPDYLIYQLYPDLPEDEHRTEHFALEYIL